MKRGIIVNNLPLCPHCSNKDYKFLKILDVDVAKIDGEPHFEFIARCKKCDTKFYYFLEVGMFERKSVDRNSDRYSKKTTEEEFDTTTSKE